MRGIAVAASRFADIHQRAAVEHDDVLFLCVASLLRHHDSRICFTASSWNIITVRGYTSTRRRGTSSHLIFVRGIATAVSRLAEMLYRVVVEHNHV